MDLKIPASLIVKEEEYALPPPGLLVTVARVGRA